VKGTSRAYDDAHQRDLEESVKQALKDGEGAGKAGKHATVDEFINSIKGKDQKTTEAIQQQIKDLYGSQHERPVQKREYRVWQTDPDNKQAVAMVAKEFTSTNAHGEPLKRTYVDPELALEALRNPQLSRTLKDAPDELKNLIINTRKDLIYSPADGKTIKSVAGRLEADGLLQKGDRIVMDTFSTPGKPPSLGADRDARMVIMRPGEDSPIEVPRKYWEKDALKNFYNHTTKLATQESLDSFNQQVAEKEQAEGAAFTAEKKHRLWAEDHNQCFTDRYHQEASMDFSDQKVRDIGGKTTQTPMAQLATEGKAPLEDPWGYARMRQDKSEAYAHNPAEAIAQAQKGIEMYTKLREGYRAQGLAPPPLDDRTAQAMNIITQAPVGVNADPAKVNATLQGLGYRDTMDAIEKIASQNELLKWSKAVKPLGAGDLSRVVRSTLTPERANGGSDPEID
jgi:hypothetical protein